MGHRPMIFDDAAKRAVSESLRLQHKLRLLVWHDTIVLEKDLAFSERTYPIGAKLQRERGFEINDPIMTFVDEQGRTVEIDGWDLAKDGVYSVIPAPDNEPF